MSPAFSILAAVTLTSAIAAMSLRNLVHCALSLTVTFAGLAAIYLQLNAQFVGLAQILVYVGAVAILIVFAVLLTRGGDEMPRTAIASSSWWVGLLIAAAAFVSLAAAVCSSVIMRRPARPPAQITVKQIGERLLMHPENYVLPLEVIGLLLTAAMIGAVIIGMQEKRK